MSGRAPDAPAAVAKTADMTFVDPSNVTIINRYLLYVATEDGKLSVAVHADGRVEYGQAYDADWSWREVGRASSDLIRHLEQARQKNRA
jgi:hypothetical protein